MAFQSKGKREVMKKNKKKKKAPLLSQNKINGQYLANLSIKIDPKLYSKKKNGK